MPHEVEDWGPTPEQRYVRMDLQRIVSEAIRKLDRAYRLIFMLGDVVSLGFDSDDLRH